MLLDLGLLYRDSKPTTIEITVADGIYTIQICRDLAASVDEVQKKKYAQHTTVTDRESMVRLIERIDASLESESVRGMPAIILTCVTVGKAGMHYAHAYRVAVPTETHCLRMWGRSEELVWTEQTLYMSRDTLSRVRDALNQTLKT